MRVIKAVLNLGVVLLMLFFVFVFLVCPPGGGGAKVQRVDVDFVAIDKAIMAYASHAGLPPAKGQGLEALVSEPGTSPKPKAWVQVMKMVPKDPWGTPYRYVPLGPKEREWRWELRSAGPDRVFGNGDDLTGEAEWGDDIGVKDGSGESRPSY